MTVEKNKKEIIDQINTVIPKLELDDNHLQKMKDLLSSSLSRDDIICIVNLVIDIYCGYLGKNHLSDWFLSLDLDKHIGEQITKMAYKDPDNFLCKGPVIKECDSEFIRIMELPTFINHYLRNTYWIPDNYMGEQQALEMFFHTPNNEPKNNFEDIKVSFRGAHENVWVTDLSTIKEFKTFDPDRFSDMICQSLGIITSKGKKIIYIRYPESFKMVSFHKPTQLDAHYRYSDYYLSIESKDYWGRTCPLDKNGKSIKESVHRSLENGLNEEFEGYLLGETSKSINNSKHILLQTAINRLNEIVQNIIY